MIEKIGFENINNIFYSNIIEKAYAKGELYGNLGIYRYETNRIPNNFINNIYKEVYIYQDKFQKDKGYRIYKEFADYRFNGYSDDYLISELQKKQKYIKEVDFPTGVVTVDGYIIGQIIHYYDKSLTIYDYIKNNNVDLVNIYEELIKIIEKLYYLGIYYLDIHPKNFLILPDNKIKLIDFDNSFIKFDNKYYNKEIMLKNLKNTINILNEILHFESVLEEFDKFEDVKKYIHKMKRVA